MKIFESRIVQTNILSGLMFHISNSAWKMHNGKMGILRRNSLHIWYADLCREIVGVMESIIQCDDIFLPPQLFHERLSLFRVLCFIFIHFIYINSFVPNWLLIEVYKHVNNCSRALSSNKKDNQIFSYTLPSGLLYVLPLYFKEMKDGL